MNERLFIRLSADSREPVRWGLLAPGAEAFADTGSLAPGELTRLAEVAAGRSVVVIVPGTDVLFTAARVPSRSARQIQKALPFMLEEQLMGDVEDQHFAIGPRQDDGQIPVAVVARARLDGWLAALREAGLNPDAVVPDAALLPVGTSVLMDGALGLLRFDNLSLFAMESELLPELLALRLGERQERLAVRLYGATEAQRADVVATVGDTVELEVIACYDPLYLLAGQYAPDSLNLLQGDYAKRKDHSALWLAWRPAAILAGVALAVQLLGTGVEAWRLTQERNALVAEVAKVYAQAFPGERPRDPYKSLKSKLAGLHGGSGSGFLPMLQQLAEGMAQVPGVQPGGLTYESTRGEMRLDVTAPDFDTLERLRQALNGLGLAVESGPASSGSDGGYSGRLVIRRAQ